MSNKIKTFFDSILEKITQATSDLLGVRDGLIAQGCDVENVPTSEYGDIIKNIPGESLDVTYRTQTFDVKTLTGITSNDKLTLTLPDDVQSISGRVFMNNPFVGTIICPDGFSKIAGNVDAYESPFYYSGVENIWLGKSLTSLGDKAIYMPHNMLKKLFVPQTLAELGEDAIFTAYSPFDIYYEGSQAEWEAITGMPEYGIGGATLHYNYSGSVEDFLNE